MKRFVRLIAGVCLAVAGCSDSPFGPTPVTTTSASPGVSFSTGGGTGGAAVTTDRLDYQPGDTVTITGTGWAADETVDLVIDEEPATHAPHAFSSVADAAGSFVNRQLVIDVDDLGVTFTLTATGRTSGSTAAWVFYDGTLEMNSATPYPFSPNQPSSAGLKDTNTIEVCNRGSATAGVKVRIRAGIFGGSPGSQTLVRELSAGDLPGTSPANACNAASTTTVVWDGKNTGGTFVADGAYTARVTDAATGTNEDNGDPRKREIIVDNTNPTVGVDAVTGGAVGSLHTITGTAGDAAYTSGSGIAAAVVSVTVEIRRVSDNALLASGAATNTGTNFNTWSFAYTPAESGAQKATATATDRADNNTTSAAATFTVTADNAAPTADAGGPYTGNEGAAIQLDGSGSSDPDNDALTYKWTVDDSGIDSGGGCELDDDTKVDPIVTCDDDSNGGTFTLTLMVDDGKGGSDSDDTTLTVANVAPTITSLAGIPVDPAPVTALVSFSGAFTDPGSNDTHTLSIDCNADDFAASMAPTAGSPVVNQAADTYAGSCSYPGAGIYRIEVIITDDDGGCDHEFSSYVVVYDPSAGFVTGGGWIDSPSGAYTADPSLAGKATFGFVSKYKKGATTPEGNTQFVFHAADFNFHSSTYDWLVVAGARAQFKGYGTVNGVAGYQFMLTAIDGQVSGGGGSDKFRIKIWNGATLVYDNQIGAADDAVPTTLLGGGSIVVQAGKK